MTEQTTISPLADDLLDRLEALLEDPALEEAMRLADAEAACAA